MIQRKIISQKKFNTFIKVLPFIFGFIVLLITWSFCEPLTLASDEPQNMIYASAVIRGQILLPQAVTNPYPLWEAKVPAWLNNLNSAYTYLGGAGPHGLTANINALINKGNLKALIPTRTNLAVLPPFIYFLIGIPTLFSYGIISAYLMRLVTSILSGIFLGIAFWQLTRHFKTKAAFSGFFLTLTPQTLLLAAVPNLNGLEIACSISLSVFTGLLITNPDKSEFFKGFCLVGACLCLTRTVSPLWVITLGLYLLIYLGVKKTIAIFKSKNHLIYFFLLAVCAIATFLWDIIKGRFPGPILFNLISNYHSQPFFERFLLSIQRSAMFYNQAYDWIGGVSPTWASLIWFFLTLLLVIYAFFASNKKQRIILVISVFFNLTIPAILESTQGATLGNWWRGQYGMPLYVQTPILAGIFIANSQHFKNDNASNITLKKASLFFLATVLYSFFSEFYFFYAMIRTYMVGTKGPILLFAVKSNWQPFPAGSYDIWILINFGLILTALLFLYRVKHSNSSQFIDNS